MNWSDGELEASVVAYLGMLADQLAGRTVCKSDVNAELRRQYLTNRTRPAVEYRMRNISTAMEELGLPVVQGYLPARNVGRNVTETLKTFIVKHYKS